MISNTAQPLEYFTGRAEYLQQIHTYFYEGKKTASLVGITGIGKSQIARKYAQVRQKDYKIIWFIDCKKDIRSQFQDLAKQINLTLRPHEKKININSIQVVNTVAQYLLTVNNWLLVIDNFHSWSEINILELFADKMKYPQQNILILSQDKKFLHNVITIKPFHREESIELLSRILKKHPKKGLSKVAECRNDYPLHLAKSAFLLLYNPYISLEEYEGMFSNKIDSLDKGNIVNPSDIGYEQSILKFIESYLNKLDSKARKLLIYTALLDNNNLYKELLYEVYKEENNSEENNDFLNALIELNKYALLEYKKSNKMEGINQTNFELHDLLQKTIEEVIDKPVMQEHFDKMIKKINAFLPEDVSEIGQIYSKHPLLLSNLESILGKIKNYQIAMVEEVHFKKHLLLLYMYKLDYLKAKELIDWFDILVKTYNIKDLSKNKMTRSAIANYLLFRGQYYDLIKDEYKTAIRNLKEAVGLIVNHEKEHYELVYTIYTILAQTEVSYGDLKNAKMNIKAAENLVNKYEKLPNKGLFYFVKALIEISEGDNMAALKTIKKGEEVDNALAFDQFTAPTYLLKAEILNRLGNGKAALSISKKLLENSDTFFEEDHELKARILNELAAAELLLGNLKEAETHINRAEQVLITHNSTLVEKDARLTCSDDLAAIYVVKGDIEFHKRNYEKALTIYKNALTTYQNRNRKNETDYISELYYKIAITANKTNDLFTFKQFLKRHEDEFGIAHNRTKTMYKQMINL